MRAVPGGRACGIARVQRGGGIATVGGVSRVPADVAGTVVQDGRRATYAAPFQS